MDTATREDRNLNSDFACQPNAKSWKANAASLGATYVDRSKAESSMSGQLFRVENLDGSPAKKVLNPLSIFIGLLEPYLTHVNRLVTKHGIV